MPVDQLDILDIDFNDDAVGSEQHVHGMVEEERQRDATPSFQWSKHWYPVSLEDCLLKDKPNKITLLGRDYVVWQDRGLWNVAKDECPHRWDKLHLRRLQITQTAIVTVRS